MIREFARQNIEKQYAMPDLVLNQMDGVLSWDTNILEEELVSCIPDKIDRCCIQCIGDLLMSSGGFKT